MKPAGCVLYILSKTAIAFFTRSKTFSFPTISMLSNSGGLTTYTVIASFVEKILQVNVGLLQDGM